MKIKDYNLFPANAPQIVNDAVLVFYFKGYENNEPILKEIRKTKQRQFNFIFYNPKHD